MKRNITLLAACLLVLTALTGCGDAKATVSDKNSALITVGKTKVTKGDIYTQMLTADDASVVLTNATVAILDSEVETTDEQKASAQATVDKYKTQFGDNFTLYLSYMGYKDENELYDNLVNNERMTALQEKYIDENWDTLLTKYTPVKAKMIYLAASSYSTSNGAYDAATAALQEIKDGADFATVAAKYGSTSSLATEQLYTRESDSLDYNVLQFMTTATTPTLSTVIANEDVTGYYIVQLTNINASQFKSDFVSYLQDLSDFSDTVYNYYFTKHNFTIYDITVYNQIQTDYSNYLVQTTGPKSSN